MGGMERWEVGLVARDSFGRIVLLKMLLITGEIWIKLL